MYNVVYRSEMHEKLLAALLDRRNLSTTDSSQHHKRWQRSEAYYMLYKKKNKKDPAYGKETDDFKSFAMPHSYAQLLTAHTYMVNVFLNRSPIFPVEAMNGGGAEKEMSMESLLQYQVRSGMMESPLSVWLLDGLRYGIGCIGNYWDEELIPVTTYTEENVYQDGIETDAKETVMETELHKGYEGNKCFNVLPYDILYDPRVALCNMQDGEFFGRRFDLHYLEAKRREKAGFYQNLKHVAFASSNAKSNDRHPSVEADDVGASTTATPTGGKVGKVNSFEMYVRLIPKEWNLNDNEHPEIWVFTVTDDKVIVGATPLGYIHNKFPFHVVEGEIDGYKQNSRGILEVSAQFNDAMTWLFDSHMYNKRQVMNNQFVYDPSKLVTKDLTTKTPGKMIRAKPAAYGTDLRQAILQLPVNDVTSQNYGDMQVIDGYMQNTVGINKDVAGQSAQSSRRSATEFRGTTSFSANRLANLAYYWSVTGFRSLGQCLVSSTQQMYDTEMKVRVAGDSVRSAESITVNPEDIAGRFDITAIDGNMPIDRMGQAQFWQQVLMQTAQDPELQMRYRRGDIFSYMCKLAGLKGIDKFKIDIVSDEEIVAMVKQGLLTGGQSGQPGAAQPAGGIPAGADTPPAATGGLPALGMLG